MASPRSAVVRLGAEFLTIGCFGSDIYIYIYIYIYIIYIYDFFLALSDAA